MASTPGCSAPPVKSLQRAEDFQQVLAQPWLARTPHFVLQHWPQGPAPRPVHPKSPQAVHLSSGPSQASGHPVDNSEDKPVDKPGTGGEQQPSGHWLGLVVPKRHAKRSVTRNLIRRQLRQVMAQALATWPAGVWCVRLRSGFSTQQFPSAASLALKRATRSELVELVGQAQRRLSRAPSAPSHG